MEKNMRGRRAIAAAAVSLLIAVPLLVSADVNRSAGRQIVDRVFAQLCARGILRAELCAPTPPQASTLKLVKTVINNNGGTATTTDFQAKIDGVNVGWGVAKTVTAGAHTASEVNMAGYTASSWGGDCAGIGTITIAAGENKTCTITNDDIEPTPPQPGHLIVDKVTVPSGFATVFNITASGTGVITGGGVATTSDATSKNYEVTAGTYSVTESALAGWVETSNTCTNVTVAAGETKTCVITNTKLPKLTVTKTIVNDSGGTATTSDFALFIDGVMTTSGVATTSTIGAHTVSETASSTYSMSISGDCAANGSVTLAAGDNKTCTITNDDIAPAQVIGHVVISEVHYDVASTTVSGSDALFEWIELYNGTANAIDLQGWFVGDASSTDMIVDSVMIQAGGRVVVAASTTPAGIPGGVPVVVLNSSIGLNGFTNDGDGARLLSATSVVVDQVGYGDNQTVPPTVSIPGSHDGHSLMRVQLTSDNDTSADWADSAIPTPGS